MKNLFIALTGAALLASCGSAHAATAAATSLGDSVELGFESVLSCDNGAATIDVSKTDRTKVLFVIHDLNIARYLTYWALERPWAFYATTALRIDFDHEFGPKYLDQPARPIQTADDISYLINTFQTYSEPLYNFSSYRRIGSVRSIYRQGEGLKIEELALENTGCAGQLRPYEYYREGAHYKIDMCDGDFYTKIKSVKNWYFQKCEAVR